MTPIPHIRRQRMTPGPSDPGIPLPRRSRSREILTSFRGLVGTSTTKGLGTVEYRKESIELEDQEGMS